MNKIKVSAFIAFAVLSYFAYVAGDMHEKDPAHNSINPALTLGVLAMLCIAYVICGKSGSKLGSPPKIRAKL
jgi:hypothetical protein